MTTPSRVPGSTISDLPATVFVVMYGEVRRRRQLGDSDMYSLFRERSLAMRWLDTRGVIVGAGGEERFEGSPGCWAMHDAGEGPGPAESTPPMIAWFQVGIDGGVASLPIQALIECAAQVVNRAFDAEVTAIQLMAPMQEFQQDSLLAMKADLAGQAYWFGDRQESHRITVTLSGPEQLQELLMAAAAFSRRADGDLDGPFTLDRARSDGAEKDPSPPFDDSFLGDHPRSSIRLVGSLSMWSPDAIGWLAAKLITLMADLGLRAPVLMTISRSSSG